MKTTPFEVFELEQIINDLEDVTFANKEQVKNVLLLYNIAMLINANNTYERFPFKLYKDETSFINALKYMFEGRINP